MEEHSDKANLQSLEKLQTMDCVTLNSMDGVKECSYHDIKKHFQLDPSFVFLNHGSYGTVPKVVREEQNRLQILMDFNPDAWFREMFPRWERSIAVISAALGAKAENLVFLPNTTTGVNTVLKCLPLKPGDGILTHTFTYKAIYNICDEVATKSGGVVHTVPLELTSITSKSIVNSYKEYLQRNSSIKVVVLEAISSCTSILFPFEELIHVCKDAGCWTVLDAAHAPGQIPLDLEFIGADFVIGNLHKWMFTSRGCAVLWAAPEHHHVIKPLVTSHCYKTGNIHKEFSMQGTLDYTPYFTVQKALGFYEDCGGLISITSHTTQLLDTAVDLLSRAWGTRGCPYPADLHAPNMRLVELPTDLPESLLAADQSCDIKDWEYNDVPVLLRVFKDRFQMIAIPLYIQRHYYIRLSAQVYNTISDYEHLKNAVNQLRTK